MSDLMQRLDSAVDGLCPCGAEPAEGSAYCSDDCRPTHIGEHTDERMSGELATAMRWRPDLITATDDEHLEPLPAGWGEYTGRFNPSLFQRTDRDAWHLRLDDGNRYVGLDVDLGDIDPTGDDARERVRATWQRLERELIRTDHTVPSDRVSSADQMLDYFRRIYDRDTFLDRTLSRVRVGVADTSAGPGDTVQIRLFADTTPLASWGDSDHHPTTGWARGGMVPDVVLVDEVADWANRWTDEHTQRLRAVFENIRPVFARIVEQAQATADAMRSAGLLAPEPSPDPMLAEIERRRSGAGAGPRDRRGLDGRRRRTR